MKLLLKTPEAEDKEEEIVLSLEISNVRPKNIVLLAKSSKTGNESKLLVFSPNGKAKACYSAKIGNFSFNSSGQIEIE